MYSYFIGPRYFLVVFSLEGLHVLTMCLLDLELLGQLLHTRLGGWVMVRVTVRVRVGVGVSVSVARP